MTDSFVTSTLNQRDEGFEQPLRPQSFDQFPGQEQKKRILQIYVRAARERGEPLGHLLLHGPPGLGKTTLAHIIANARGTNIRTSSGPVLEKPGDLAGLLTACEEGDVLFIDEIHRLTTTIEEYLYSAMEDFHIDIIIDQGAASRSIPLDLPRFTLIGATTRKGSLSAPLLSRFQMDVRLDYYPADVLQTIVTRSAGILNIEIEPDGAFEIARRSRGTPRIANNLLAWVRDYAQVEADNVITQAVALEALEIKDIDENGLDEMDRRYLEALIFKFGGGPTGIKTLAVSLGEEEGTIEDVVEPFLIQEGYVQRSPRGRMATPKAVKTTGGKLSGQGDELGLFDNG